MNNTGQALDLRIFLIVPIYGKSRLSIDSLTADEMRNLLDSLAETTQREAEEGVVARVLICLCHSCFDRWDWVRLRNLSQKFCGCCGTALELNQGDYFRAGFVAVSSLAAEANQLQARIEEAQKALSRCLQRIEQPTSTFGPDDLLTFALCRSCQPQWLDDPFDSRDWTE